jgi:ATP synthase protein I
MAQDDDEALRARLGKLAGELKTIKPRTPAPPPGMRPGSAASAWSLGTKAASEFVAAVIVGAGIGYGLDWAAHTKPLFTIVFFLVGVAAGVFGVVRATSPRTGS